MDPNDPRLDDIALRLSRLDGPSLQQQKDLVQLLQEPGFRSLASSLDIDVAGLLAQHDDLRRSLTALLQAAIYFGPMGWTVMGHQISSTSLVEAVAIWESTYDEAAVDERLTRAWADGYALRRSFGPMTTLAGKHSATLDVLLERNRLLQRALDHHKRGEYEASTILVLSQVDGLTLDFTENKHGFFVKGNDKDFIDQATVAGMPEFLATVFRAVNLSDNTTSLSTAFRRHPIVHGRYLGFGTETNSTKAFALMSGVLEWLKPRAETLTARLQAEHEARYSGSDERDEQGKRMDRRGFSEARESLRWLAIRETNEYQAHGRYNRNLHGMFPREGIGMMKRRNGTTLTVASDGQSYWAWCQSDTDVCFGIAARSGDLLNSLYVDVGPPGAPGDDPRWQHQLDDEPPDWSGD